MKPALVIGTLAFGALAPAKAEAQSFQCRMSRAPVSVPIVKRDSPVRRMPVTGYTFALGWSPEFCRTRQSSGRDATQCSGSNGRFGFIVHGLWPDGSNGRWPQWCATNRRPTSAMLRRNLCHSPSPRLLTRQWFKHGSCMTSRPDTYFNVQRILFDAWRWPDIDRMSREDGLTVGTLRRRLASANPGLMERAIGIKLNRRGWLQELRVCYGKDFMPTPCDPRRFGPKDGTPLKIWRGL